MEGSVDRWKKKKKKRSMGCENSPASEGPDAISRQQRACLYAQRAQPRYSDYLPLFQRGSAPVSMTTWIPFCSVGLDIQSVAREGCRGATQQMHSSQQDALLLLDLIYLGSAPTAVS
ncbi:hypothetical protein ACER0C_006340 [Sarotherodon galilaeus]